MPARECGWVGSGNGQVAGPEQAAKGQFDPFPGKAGNLNALTHAQYVINGWILITIAAARPHHIGAMAHPLNRAVIDPDLRIVTEGYGILQHGLGVSVQSASRSRLASIYSGANGLYIYTRAISDAYQDLYGEGIFTGKAFTRSMPACGSGSPFSRAIPCSAHDLIEGSLPGWVDHGC